MRILGRLSSSAIEEFLRKTSGNGSLVMGQDVKIAAVSDLGWGALENGGSPLDGGLLHTDIMAVSADISGVMLDWSFVGGSVLYDEALNHTIYGPDSTPKSIIEGSGTAQLVPPECHALYRAMDEVISRAESDPRKFNGFERRWKSSSLLATDAELRKLE